LLSSGNDLDLLAENAALGIELFGEELERLEADFADAGAAARQRIDVADLDRFLRPDRTWLRANSPLTGNYGSGLGRRE
jgi:hypothetical protein